MLFATLRSVTIVFFRFLGRLFFYLFKKRRNIALKNVTLCHDFLYKSSIDAIAPRKLVQQSFVSLGHALADFLLLRGYTKSNIDRYVTADHIEYLERARARGKGVIISAAHFGSWELAAHYFACKGFPSLIIYNQFKTYVWLDRAIKKQRTRSGNSLIDKKSSFLSLYKHVKKGGIVTLVTDQHAAPPDGEKLSFLGQPAWTHTAFVKMSIKTGAVILPVFMFVEGLSKYTIKFASPIDPEAYATTTDPCRAMAQACNNAVEDAVLQAPHLWMWQHRRFKA